MEKVLKWRNSSIAYAIYGNGELPLIAFHGYGQDKSSFEPLIPALEKTYTVYAIDLPFHGNTRWKEGEAFTQADLEDLIDSFFQETGLMNTVSLMGYSIGGNFVLGLVQRCPEKVGEAWLIASDGLSPKHWFNFLTKTMAGKWLFRLFIIFPQPVNAFLWISRLTQILPGRVVRFFLNNINSREKRKLLYLRWHSVSRIRGNLRLVIKEVAKRRIPVYLIFGKNDQIISLRHVKKFARNVATAQLVLPDMGHQLLVKEIKLYLDGLLNSDQKKTKN